MKVSINWLSKLVDIKDITPEQIADRLTFAGVEVEEISRLANATGLVIGQVLTCEEVPDSHLHLCQVDLGPKHGIKQIICGAPNVRKGLKVIVAMVGAKLPGVTIGNSIIRGIQSDGMLCSLLELGVNEEMLSDYQKAGIEELDENAPVGDNNPLGYLNLDDTIIDVNVTPNRADVLGLNHFFKEVAAILNRKVIKEYKCELVRTGESKYKAGSATPLCDYFSMTTVEGVVVKPSPKWMQNILTAHGIKCINNIVDIGNYVTLMTAQPLHMYDADKLESNNFVVKSDFNGKVVALDEKEYDIKPGDICITNNNKTMCLGGVMGSTSCAVNEDTKNVVVEAANFDAATIRRTSIRLALSSESSMRFVKGINPNQYLRVLDLTAKLLVDICHWLYHM